MERRVGVSWWLASTSDSKGSVVVVGDQGPDGRLAGVVVVPDCCGQGEQPLQDPNADAVDGATTMAFQVQLALEGVVDGLDELTKRLEQGASGAGGPRGG